MQYSLLRSSLVASSLFLAVNAWPVIRLFPQEQQKRAPASYSVVPVDGGSTPGSAPTATITNLITRTQLLTTTQIATSVLTESDEPTTIILTNTVTLPTTIIETPAPVVVTQTPTVAPAVSAPAALGSSSSYTFVTVTVTDSSLPVTRPYDDGQWHTTYWYTMSSGTETASPTPTPEIAAAFASPATPSPPTPSVDNGMWHPPAGWNSTWGGKI